jgi:Tfp pilus assembly protein PilX
MTARLRGQGGWAMVTAISLMFIMVSLGLAAAAIVDTQTQQSARERLDESSFNLAEGVLTAQSYVLTRSWPGGASTAYPASCNQSSVLTNCPDPNLIKAQYNTVDYGNAPLWTVQVRDNTSGDFYSDSGTATASHYDSNNGSPDGKMWVRATATVKGKTRAIVGLVQVDRQTEQLPKSVIVAGSMSMSNSGNKPIVCTKLPDNPLGGSCDGSSTQIGPVQLRCSSSDPTCLNISKETQIQPKNIEYGYNAGPGLAPDELDRLRNRAVADGTYWPPSRGCPPSMQGPDKGMIVFVDNQSCTFTSNTEANSLTQPGVFIINNGNLSVGGSASFYGLIYIANPPVIGPAFNLGGSVSIIGSIQVDGNGRIVAGSSKVNFVFDDFVFGKVLSYGAAHLVQNKWREFVPTG